MSRHIINQRMHNARGAEQPPDDWSNSVDAESSRETLRSRLTQAPWRLLVEVWFVEGKLCFLPEIMYVYSRKYFRLSHAFANSEVYTSM